MCLVKTINNAKQGLIEQSAWLQNGFCCNNENFSVSNSSCDYGQCGSAARLAPALSRKHFLSLCQPPRLNFGVDFCF